jgi:hypothetical protein
MALLPIAGGMLAGPGTGAAGMAAAPLARPAMLGCVGNGLANTGGATSGLPSMYSGLKSLVSGCIGSL